MNLRGDDETLRFRPLKAGDLRLVHEWLERPHVQRWWTERETYEEVVEHYLPSIEGEEPTDHYVVLLGFVEEVVFASPATTGCIAGPDVRNVSSIRAFEKAGFRIVGEFIEDGEPHALVRRDR
jgi:RimJ/RimL family protein N-acetyltransferase